MTYRVSTNRSGDKRWWQEHDTIPDSHTAIRPATEAETKIMDKIAHAKGMPPLALGERVAVLMAETASSPTL